MNFTESLRKFASGSITESALQSNLTTDADIKEYEEDQQFIQECMALGMPLIMQEMILGEAADELDENVKNAVITLQNYFVGQGLISEAAAISISNPKINVVRLNKQAQINRLTTILTLKMGRKANHKAYKKYKMGQKIKKSNMEELRRIYGAKAERLAKKIWAKTQRSPKAESVAASNKSKK